MTPVRSPLARLSPVWALWTTAALVVVPACSSITVRRVHAPDLIESWHASLLSRRELSPRTRQTLRQWDLADVYHNSPADAAARLHAEVVKDPQPDLLFALAEINYLRGQTEEDRGTPEAICCYYLCAGYAFHYLFDTYRPPHNEPAVDLDPEAPPLLRLADLRPPAGVAADVFDPRFRLACDLYNAGLAKCIAAAQRVGQLDPRSALHLPTCSGHSFTLSVDHVGFDWKPEEFGPLLLCEDYEVTGLTNQHRTYGLGVPLIGTRAGNAPATPAGAYYPREASFPVTAFFRFEGGLAELGELRTGRLELYNPLAVQAVAVAGRPVPLETDLSTPLAYFLANSKLDGIGYRAFLCPDRIRNRTGIHMLDPYQPGKIPVVLVHGLLSSPLTWAPVFNDLQADPVLRRRYQFWYYFYPTSNPYLATAADLRDELGRLRNALDPRHEDRALDQMVFVGHSMGGLVSKLVTVSGGTDFWHLISNEPLTALNLQPETRSELQQTFYFQRESSVKRVIFIATPHHGSKLSPSPLGRLAVKLASLPRNFLATTREVIEENPGLTERTIPTSVDMLAPAAPALELLAARPRPAGVHYHSIIGVLPSRSLGLERLLPAEGPGDGVVPYGSAHIENADSELIVPADHFEVHHHPLAVLEVRRILLEHYQAVAREQAANGVLPVSLSPRSLPREDRAVGVK